MGPGNSGWCLSSQATKRLVIRIPEATACLSVVKCVESGGLMTVFLRQFKQYKKMVKHLTTNIRDQDRYNTFVPPIDAASTNT